MTVFDRRPRLRWAVPAALVALIVGGTVVGSVAASADSGLPPITAEQLLVDLQAPATTTVSGTVVAKADLGIPDLPMSMARDAGPSSLISGTHTVRVWSDGPEHTRLAMLANADEYDLVRNGTDIWAYSNAAKTAEHLVMPERSPMTSAIADPAMTGIALPTTPQEAAQQALAAIDQATTVTTSGVSRVAGRDVYELILTPKQSDTLVSRVVIAVDGQTHVPLRVQVFSTKMQTPAYEVGFTSVDFGPIDPSVFAFSPAPGVLVNEHTVDHPDQPLGQTLADAPRNSMPTIVGTGWSTVIVATLPADALTGADTSALSGMGAQASAMLQSLPRTSGPWGTGTVLEGTLFTAILTDDGHLAIGAVSPETLGAALASA